MGLKEMVNEQLGALPTGVEGVPMDGRACGTCGSESRTGQVHMDSLDHRNSGLRG